MISLEPATLHAQIKLKIVKDPELTLSYLISPTEPVSLSIVYPATMVYMYMCTSALSINIPNTIRTRQGS